MRWYKRLNDFFHEEATTPVFLCAAVAFLILGAVYLSSGRNLPDLFVNIDPASQTGGGWWCDSFSVDPFGPGCSAQAKAFVGNFSATPATIAPGQSSTLGWQSLRGHECFLAGGPFGSGATYTTIAPYACGANDVCSFSANTGPLAQTTTFTAACRTPGTLSEPGNVVVTVGAAAAQATCSWGGLPSSVVYAGTSYNYSYTTTGSPTAASLYVPYPALYAANPSPSLGASGSIPITFANPGTSQRIHLDVNNNAATGGSGYTSCDLYVNVSAQAAPSGPATGLSRSCNSTNTQATLTWTAAPGADYQEVVVNDPATPNCSPPAPTVTGAPGYAGSCGLAGTGIQADYVHMRSASSPSSVVVNITPGKNYTWTVQGSNASGFMAASSQQSMSCGTTAPPPPTDVCPSLPGNQTTYPAGSSPANSCACPSGSSYTQATNSCQAVAPTDLCPSLPGTQTSYPAGSSPANSCTCPASAPYNQGSNSCQTTAPAISQPALSITGNNQSGSVSVTVGQPVTVRGTFVAASGDALVRTALNDYQNNALPGVPNNTPASPKTYIFTPTAPGSYIFYPAAQTAAYPTWNNYNSSLTVSVACPSGQTQQGNTCVTAPVDVCGNISGVQTSAPANGSASNGTCSCNSGYALQGSSCVATAACGAHQIGTPPNCVCDVGYQMQGGTCVQVLCPGPHEINWPACTCAGGYSRDGATNVCVREAILNIKVNGLDTTRVRKGASVTVTWSASGVMADSCSVRSNTGTTVGAGDSGTRQVTIANQTTLTLSCQNDAGSTVQKSVNVQLIPDFIET